MTITKKVTINVSEEREELREFNARVRECNRYIVAKGKASGLKTKDIEKIETVPVMVQTLERDGLTIQLSVESKGLVATTVVGKSKVVLFYNATGECWDATVYGGKGESVNLASYSDKSQVWVKDLCALANRTIKLFNLDKMNVGKRLLDIRSYCMGKMEALKERVEAVEAEMSEKAEAMDDIGATA